MWWVLYIVCRPSITIIQYIVYIMLTGPIYKIQDLNFFVQRCDIARACEGYITSEDTKWGSYMRYIGPVSILYTCILYYIYMYIYIIIIIYIYIYIYIYVCVYIYIIIIIYIYIYICICYNTLRVLYQIYNHRAWGP